MAAIIEYWDFPDTDVSRRGSNQRLRLQIRLCECVSHECFPTQSLNESPAPADAATNFDHRRQPSHQPVVETRNVSRGRVLQRPQIQPRRKGRMTQPDSGTLKHENFSNRHGLPPATPNETAIDLWKLPKRHHRGHRCLGTGDRNVGGMTLKRSGRHVTKSIPHVFQGWNIGGRGT